MSENRKIIFPILLIAVLVFSTFGWIHWFQNHQMNRVVAAERLLDGIRQEMQDLNRTIQSGILTLEERYAVESARHSLKVVENLHAFAELHPAEAEAIKRMYVDYFVKIVSINSLFLEKRQEEGQARLAELESSYAEIKRQMDRWLAIRIEQHEKAVATINMFMVLTSVMLAAVLTLIAALFMHYARKRKEAEEALVESEKMASLGLLSAGVAHEIRNPLTIILHGVELLGESIPAGSGEHEIIAGIKKAVLRAESIIIGLLSSSPHRSSCREWDIVPLAQEVIAELEQNGKLKNIRVETEFPAEPLECSMDRSPFGQALLNIMNNAVEAMPDGGELKVACRATGSGKVAIVIMDDGESIPESELRKVFDPFYTTKQNSGNMGLGLSIAKGIVDAHGGSLAIRSTPGRGTAVTIIIPCSKMGELQKISKDHRHKSGCSV